jgi:hypothetical protein
MQDLGVNGQVAVCPQLVWNPEALRDCHALPDLETVFRPDLAKGFVVSPMRGIVERTLDWLALDHRYAKA